MARIVARPRAEAVDIETPAARMSDVAVIEHAPSARRNRSC
ncbi:hypothetical protein [Streptomyces aureus]|nr:hypothetical protein [Streptomyces aureus]